MIFIIFLALLNPCFAFTPKSFELSFVEEHISTLSKKIKKTQGVLYYKYPKQLRLEILKPSKTTFVSNSKKSWYYTPSFLEGEPGEVTISPSKDYFLIDIFDLLQRKIASNKKFEVKSSKKMIVLTFVKSISKKTRIKKIIFFFKSKSKIFKNISQMNVVDLQNKKKKFKFFKIETKPSFKKVIFTFQIPPNTRTNH